MNLLHLKPEEYAAAIGLVLCWGLWVLSIKGRR